MKCWGLLAGLFICVLLAVPLRSSVFASTVCWQDGAPVKPVKIFEGIIYGCERLERSREGSGLIHWVSVDLTAPGLELYVTPLNPHAVNAGSHYRLRRVADVAKDEHLAVAINGSMFTSIPAWRPALSGDFATGVETVVADHVASHFWEHTYLLWFDETLAPRLSGRKPPAPEELALAQWGVGGQGIGLWDGKVRPSSHADPDARTAIAVDRPGKRLFLVVANHISPDLMMRKLAALGAKDGMLLDGGSSSAMAIGDGARGITPGGILSGARPVATQFGIKAARLDAALPPQAQ